MKKIVHVLISIAFLLSISVNSLAVAGESCDSVNFVCPGVMCEPTQMACRDELEREATLRDLEQWKEKKAMEKRMAVEIEKRVAIEVEKRVAAEQKKQTQLKFPMPENAEPDSHATKGWSCRMGFHQVGDSCKRDASVKGRTLTKQQKSDISSSDSTLPANAEPDSYATQGWSCRVGFHQVGLACKKNI